MQKFIATALVFLFFANIALAEEGSRGMIVTPICSKPQKFEFTYRGNSQFTLDTKLAARISGGDKKADLYEMGYTLEGDGQGTHFTDAKGFRGDVTLLVKIDHSGKVVVASLSIQKQGGEFMESRSKGGSLVKYETIDGACTGMVNLDD